MEVPGEPPGAHSVVSACQAVVDDLVGIERLVCMSPYQDDVGIVPLVALASQSPGAQSDLPAYQDDVGIEIEYLVSLVSQSPDAQFAQLAYQDDVGIERLADLF